MTLNESVRIATKGGSRNLKMLLPALATILFLFPNAATASSVPAFNHILCTIKHRYGKSAPRANQQHHLGHGSGVHGCAEWFTLGRP
jgi:hypothetical protein